MISETFVSLNRQNNQPEAFTSKNNIKFDNRTKLSTPQSFSGVKPCLHQRNYFSKKVSYQFQVFSIKNTFAVIDTSHGKQYVFIASKNPLNNQTMRDNNPRVRTNGVGECHNSKIFPELLPQGSK